MEENQNEIEFYKLGLTPEDILLLKVNISGLTEEEATKKLAEVREDPFVKYIESKGNKVIISYTGVDFNIMRLNETDKVIAYLNVDAMNEDQETNYINYIKGKLDGDFGDKLICVPVRNGSPVLAIKEEK